MIDSMDLDCIVIASPSKFHSEMVSYSLTKGLHVFCEKPFVLKPVEGQTLAQRAKKLNLVNQVGYHNRFLGTFMELKRLLSLGVLGEIYHFTGESYGPVVLRGPAKTWRSRKEEGGGCLYDYASHTVDLIHYLLGKPKKVEGTQLNQVFSIGVEDAVYSTLTLENGLSGQLSVNWSDESCRKMTTQITVVGKKGKMVADATELKIYLSKPDKDLNLDKGWTMLDITKLAPGIHYYLRGEEYSLQIDHFVSCMKNNISGSKSSFESAVVTDQVIEMLLNDGK